MKSLEKENQIKGKNKFKEYENTLNKENPFKKLKILNAKIFIKFIL